jgi:hypothetical protein
VLSLESVSPGAQPFVAALLARLFPKRPIVVVTAGLKTQEIFQQDMETWAGGGAKPLFYPDWEILPHEARLPHADVSANVWPLSSPWPGNEGPIGSPSLSPMSPRCCKRRIPAAELKKRIRHLRRGESLDPLDLIEWLEEQSYEPEAQVTEKGTSSMRGGIVDVWPLASPWPVRLEFFGNELESLRYFDPITQFRGRRSARSPSRRAAKSGLLKKEQGNCGRQPAGISAAGAIFLLCEPDLLAEQAGVTRSKFRRRPAADFMGTIPGRNVAARHDRHPVSEIWTPVFIEDVVVGGQFVEKPMTLDFQSLEVFRPSAIAGPSRTSPRRNERSFSGNSTAGCARIMPCISFATTTANGSVSRKSGANTAWAKSARCACASAPLSRGFSFRAGQTGRRDRRGNFRALQSAASAPPQIAARPFQPVAAGHQFFRIGRGRLRGASATRHRALSGFEAHAGSRQPHQSAVRRGMPGHRIRAPAIPTSSRPNFTCR